MKRLTREEKMAILDYIATLKSWISFCQPPVSAACRSGLAKLRKAK